MDNMADAQEHAEMADAKSMQKARIKKPQVSMREMTKATSKYSLVKGEHQSKCGIQ